METEDDMETSVTWSAPDGSFSKQILIPVGICCGPEDGSICEISLELINSPGESNFPLDISTIGYPLGGSVSVQIGEADTEVARILDKCILSMKPGETSHFTFSIQADSFIRSDEKYQQVSFRIQLKKIVNQKMLCELTDSEKLERAQHHKEKGTVLYRTGNVLSAFRRFSKSLQYLHLMSSERTIRDEIYTDYRQLKCQCHLNLAACQLQAGGFHHAVTNCTKALELDSCSVKAFYRRAQGYIEMGELQEAVSDLMKASGIEPQNGAVQQLLQNARFQFQAQNRALSAGLSKMFRA